MVLTYAIREIQAIVGQQRRGIILKLSLLITVEVLLILDRETGSINAEQERRYAARFHFYLG